VGLFVQLASKAGTSDPGFGTSLLSALLSQAKSRWFRVHPLKKRNREVEQILRVHLIERSSVSAVISIFFHGGGQFT